MNEPSERMSSIIERLVDQVSESLHDEMGRFDLIDRNQKPDISLWRPDSGPLSGREGVFAIWLNLYGQEDFWGDDSIRHEVSIDEFLAATKENIESPKIANDIRKLVVGLQAIIDEIEPKGGDAH